MRGGHEEPVGFYPCGRPLDSPNLKRVTRAFFRPERPFPRPSDTSSRWRRTRRCWWTSQKLAWVSSRILETLRESREPFFGRKDPVTRQAGGGAPDGVGGRLRSLPGSLPHPRDLKRVTRHPRDIKRVTRQSA